LTRFYLSEILLLKEKISFINLNKGERKEVIDLQEGYRIIDLSEKVIPDLLEINGDYTWGTNVRKFELNRFMAKHDQMIMHFVNTETRRSWF